MGLATWARCLDRPLIGRFTPWLFLRSGWSACCAAAWCCGCPSHSRRPPTCRSVASLGIDQALERLGVEDADLALMDLDEALV
eukprot:gene33376-55992_t